MQVLSDLKKRISIDRQMLMDLKRENGVDADFGLSHIEDVAIAAVHRGAPNMRGTSPRSVKT